MNTAKASNNNLKNVRDQYKQQKMRNTLRKTNMS